jgi:MFS-type transporter involved in bile tolerance (Atg22 family)
MKTYIETTSAACIHRIFSNTQSNLSTSILTWRDFFLVLQACHQISKIPMNSLWADESPQNGIVTVSAGQSSEDRIDSSDANLLRMLQGIPKVS